MVPNLEGLPKLCKQFLLNIIQYLKLPPLRKGKHFYRIHKSHTNTLRLRKYLGKAPEKAVLAEMVGCDA